MRIREEDFDIKSLTNKLVVNVGQSKTTLAMLQLRMVTVHWIQEFTRSINDKFLTLFYLIMQYLYDLGFCSTTCA